uniref:F-box domain-containing protein n=1 Tax=Mesocestoides corti TaxID=53468 RepID=A0A5K3FAU1_MESCO
RSVSNKEFFSVVRYGTQEGGTISRFNNILAVLPELRLTILEEEIDVEALNLKVFARSSMPKRLPLLEDFINLFGRLGGFDAIVSRFQSQEKQPLTMRLIFEYLKPFEACCYYLTDEVVNEFLLPMTEMAVAFLKNLTDEDIRQLIRLNQRSSHFMDFSLIRTFYQRIYGSNYNNEELDDLRLQFILRVMK